MLHLIFIYLTPGEGQPAAYTLPPIFDSRENSSGGPLSAPLTIRVRQALSVLGRPTWIAAP